MGVVKHPDEVLGSRWVDGVDRFGCRVDPPAGIGVVDIGAADINAWLGQRRHGGHWDRWSHDFITNGGHGPEIYLARALTRHCQKSQCEG
jgi:hypothetical protein